MAPLVVQVTEINEVQPHPNADRLEIATVGGWQSCVGKGQYAVGDKVVYFPPDTLLPPEKAVELGVDQHLKKGTRVQKIRLRGEPSFGLILAAQPEWELGQDVAEFYGATKWEPEVRAWSGRGTPGGQRFGIPEPPKFLRYTELDNLRNFPGVFLPNEQVIVEEKIHGWNVRLAVIEGEFYAGSRKVCRSPEDQHLGFSFWNYYDAPGVRNLLTDLGDAYDAVELFGEGYGSTVQNLHYGVTGADGFVAFDLCIDGKYLNWDDRQDLFIQYGIASPPLLYVGPYDIKTIARLSEGESVLGGNHMREGVVVRPLQERTHPKVGRVVMKFIGNEYLLAKGNTDFAEV